MNDYQFQFFNNGHLVGEGFGYGNNAVEAFENAFKSGSVFLPSNEPVDVVATSVAVGVAIRFEVYKP